MSGEDPTLGATLAPHTIQGIQSKGVIANAKHWVDTSRNRACLEQIAAIGFCLSSDVAVSTPT